MGKTNKSLREKNSGKTRKPKTATAAKTNKNPIKYTQSVLNRTSYRFDENIMQSEKSLPHLRKEIARVLHNANRRIQNVEKSGAISPAVAALNLDANSGFSKFSMSGKNWNELKLEYAKAVAFLKSPTSTAQGARQYEKHLQEQLQLPKENFDKIKAKILGLDTGEGAREFKTQYVFKYKEFELEFERAALDVADQIETDAQKAENVADFDNALYNDVMTAALTGRGVKPTVLKNILDAFNDFGV